MGYYEDLQVKCKGGVGPDCTQREYNDYLSWMQEYGSSTGNAGSGAGNWFDRIIGGISDLSGVAFGIYDRSTGYTPGYTGPYYPQQDNQGRNTTVWIIVIVGALLLGVIMFFALRGNKRAVKPA